MERDATILILRLAFAGLLYAFLFQLLIVIWRDLRQPAPSDGRLQPALEVLFPAESGRAIGESFPLEAITPIGRGEQNAIVLADPSVSGHHALVAYRMGQWWVEDLKSTNGTFVNDVRMDQPTVIRTGDVLTIGAVRLRVRL